MDRCLDTGGVPRYLMRDDATNFTPQREREKIDGSV